MEWPMPWPKVIGWKSAIMLFFRQRIRWIHRAQSQDRREGENQAEEAAFLQTRKGIEGEG
jgi:hypothetical protein